MLLRIVDSADGVERFVVTSRPARHDRENYVEFKGYFYLKEAKFAKYHGLVLPYEDLHRLNNDVDMNDSLLDCFNAYVFFARRERFVLTHQFAHEV